MLCMTSGGLYRIDVYVYRNVYIVNIIIIIIIISCL